jgi:large subunit ribosomal protein L21
MEENKDFAIISTGGKQYKVSEGDSVVVELIDTDAGKKITFTDVLLLQTGGKTAIGTPTLSGAQVTATVEEKFRGDKLLVFKKKRRKGYKKTTGHRQDLLRVTIDSISGSGVKPAAKTAKTKAETAKTAEKKKPAEKKAAEKAPANKAPAKKAAAKKAPAKKAPAKKAAAKKAPAKKAPAKKTAGAAKKSAPTKSATKKAAPKKTTAKKADKE